MREWDQEQGRARENFNCRSVVVVASISVSRFLCWFSASIYAFRISAHSLLRDTSIIGQLTFRKRKINKIKKLTCLLACVRARSLADWLTAYVCVCVRARFRRRNKICFNFGFSTSNVCRLYGYGTLLLNVFSFFFVSKCVID